MNHDIALYKSCCLSELSLVMHHYWRHNREIIIMLIKLKFLDFEISYCYKSVKSILVTVGPQGYQPPVILFFYNT